MKKKIHKIGESFSPSNSKFISAVLDVDSTEIFAASDESKSIFIWKDIENSPILVILY